MSASATSLGTLVIELTGDSLRYRAMWREAEEMANTSTGNIVKYAKFMSVAVVAALAAVGTAAVVEFGKFDEAMTESLAIMEDVSESTRRQMEMTARDIAKNTRIGATAAAQSYLYLASAGWTAQQAMKALPQVAKFASAANIDMAKSTDLLTSSQAGLGLVSKDAAINLANLTRVTDVLTQAANISNASAEDLAISLRTKVAAGARLLGKDVEEVVAVLGAYADQGIKAENAGEQLSQMMRDLQNAVIDQKTVWKEYGLEVYDSQGRMRPLVAIIKDLEGATASLNDRQKTMLFQQLGFQDRSVSAVKALLGTSEKIKEYEKSLRSAGGATDVVAKKQLVSLNAQLDITKNRANDLLLTIGSDLVPVVKDFNKWIGDSADAQSGFATKAQLVSDVIRTGLVVALGVAADVMYGINGIVLVGQMGVIKLAQAYEYFVQAGTTGFLALGAIIEGVLRGWQRLFYTAIYGIRIGFSEFAVWAKTKSIEVAEALNRILPKANQYTDDNFFNKAREDVASWKASLEEARTAKDLAMASTENVHLDALLKQAAEFNQFRADLNAGTDKYGLAITGILDDLSAMGKAGRPSDAITASFTSLGTAASTATKAIGAATAAAAANAGAADLVATAYNRLSPEVVALRKEIAYAWEAGLVKLEEYDKMLADHALTESEYARARHALNLKGSAEDPFETAIYQVGELSAQMQKGIISANEYQNAVLTAMTGATPSLGMDMLNPTGKQDITAMGQTGIDDLDNLGQITREESIQQRIYDIQKEAAEKSLALSGLTEKQRLGILKQMEQNHKLQMMNFENSKNSLLLNSAAGLAGSLMDIAGNLAGKQSGIFKVMFAVSKAFAIADAIIKIQQGIAAAAALPFPANIPAMASVAAATSSIVSNIQAVKMASFLGGGSVPDGPRVGGIDGMGGKMAVLHPGEKILDPKNGGTGMSMNVTIINNTDTDVSAQPSADGRDLEVRITKRVKAEIASGVRAGGDDVSRAFEQTYNVRRGR